MSIHAPSCPVLVLPMGGDPSTLCKCGASDRTVRVGDHIRWWPAGVDDNHVDGEVTEMRDGRVVGLKIDRAVRIGHLGLYSGLMPGVVDPSMSPGVQCRIERHKPPVSPYDDLHAEMRSALDADDRERAQQCLDMLREVDPGLYHAADEQAHPLVFVHTVPEDAGNFKIGMTLEKTTGTYQSSIDAFADNHIDPAKFWSGSGLVSRQRPEQALSRRSCTQRRPASSPRSRRAS